jgi:hypothetical protein
VGKQDVLQLLKWMMIIRENLQNGRKCTFAIVSCCLRTWCSYICNPNFHTVLGLKNVPPEGINSSTWKLALLFVWKERWYKGVLMTKGVTHCHCCTWMFSYAGIIYDVYIRRKQSFDSWQISHEAEVHRCSVEGIWGQPRNSACTTLLSVCTNANCGCLQTELLVCLSKAWHVIWSVLQNLNLILHHLPR